MDPKLKILIVDDNTVNLKLYKAVLKGSGREILTADSGEIALEVLNEEEYISLVLMDIQMPGMNGFEVVEKIRASDKWKDLPVIFITGFYNSDEFALRGYKLGAFDYIYKPVDNDILKNKVNIFLKLQQQQQQLEEQSRQLQRKSKELSIALEALAEGVIVVDHTGEVVIKNTAAENLIEQEVRNVSCNKVFDIVEPLLDDSCKDFIRSAFSSKNESEQEIKHRQIKINSTDGSKKIVSASYSLIDLQDGKDKGIIFVFKDITEQIAVENQLVLAQKMESVGRLAAGIAHEINTPMQFVGDNTYFLKDAFEEIISFINKSKDYLSENNEDLTLKINELEEEHDIEFLKVEIPVAIERTRSGIERVSNIVRAMKNFAHPGGKKKTKVNINKGIEDTITISRNEWKYTSEIETDFDSSIPPIECLPDELNQVILNMIINSVHAITEKYGKNSPEKGKINIRTALDDNHAVITIKDNGSGIAQENLNKVFDPFFTTKEVGEGTGQGLAIVHDIICNKHNGSLTVDSVNGEGAIFYIKLPLNPG